MWSVPWFDCDESLTCHGLNSNLRYFGCFTPICSCGESHLFVSWCVGDRYDMVGSDEDHGRSRRLGANDRGWSSIGQVLSGRTIERLGDVVCGLYRAQEDEEHGFLGSTSKPRLTVSLGLASKPMNTVLVVWPQNHSHGFPGLGLRTGSSSLVIWPTKSQLRILGLGLKTKWAMVCRFVPQHRREDEDGVGHASRSSGLLHLEVSQARVSQSSLKSSGGAAQILQLES
jgi:hypothetical protein